MRFSVDTKRSKNKMQVFKVKISYKESLKWIKDFEDPSIHINFSNKYLDLDQKQKEQIFGLTNSKNAVRG